MLDPIIHVLSTGPRRDTDFRDPTSEQMQTHLSQWIPQPKQGRMKWNMEAERLETNRSPEMRLVFPCSPKNNY